MFYARSLFGIFLALLAQAACQITTGVWEKLIATRGGRIEWEKRRFFQYFMFLRVFFPLCVFPI